MKTYSVTPYDSPGKYIYKCPVCFKFYDQTEGDICVNCDLAFDIKTHPPDKPTKIAPQSPQG